MGRKVVFMLEMKNGEMVDTLEELRRNFSIVQIRSYIQKGNDLDIWLRDRGEIEIADKIKEIDLFDENFTRKICDIFEVQDIDISNDVLEKETERLDRVDKLKKYTDVGNYFDEIDIVAFNQEELSNLLQNNSINKVLLCGASFQIPICRESITYIGINNPTVVIDSEDVIDWKEKNIDFENIVFDEKYQKIMDEDNRKIKKNDTRMRKTIYESFDVTFFGSIKSTYCGIKKCLENGYFEIESTKERLILTIEDKKLAECVLEDIENLGIKVEDNEIIEEFHIWDNLPEFTFSSYPNAKVIPRLLCTDDGTVFGYKEEIITPYTDQYIDYLSGTCTDEIIDFDAWDLLIYREHFLMVENVYDEIYRYLLEYDGWIYYFHDSIIIRKKGDKKERIYPGRDSLIRRVVAYKDKIWLMRLRDFALVMYDCVNEQLNVIKESVDDFTYSDNYIYYCKNISIYKHDYEIYRCSLDGKNDKLVKKAGWTDKEIKNIRIRNGRLCYKENQGTGIHYFYVTKEIDLDAN